MKHLKGHITGITLTIVSAIALVLVLAWRATKPEENKAVFIRTFVNQELKSIANIKRDQSIVDIASVGNGSIYFTSKDPAKIIKKSINLDNQEIITLRIPDDKKISTAFLTIIEYPKVHILAGNMPGIIIASMDENPKVVGLERSLFSRGVKINNSSYIFRGFNTGSGADQVFFKKNIETGTTDVDKGLIEQRKDGGIGTDGFLSYDESAHLLIYSFFYQNKFLCIDTNLNLVYAARTIDPNPKTQVTTGRVGATFTNLTPSKFINGKNCVYNGTLYINSKVSASNEKPAEFNNNSAIDMYDVKTGKYKGSIYIPGFKGEKVRSFKVFSKHIIALYKNNIVVYTM